MFSLQIRILAVQFFKLMIKIVNWLGERKWVNIGLVFAYMLALIFLHDTFVNLSVWIMRKLTMDGYDTFIAVFAGLVLLVFIFFFVKNLKEHIENRWLKIMLLAGTILFFLVHLRVLLVLNIELIHSVQFGILALLIFPLSRRFSFAMFFVMLCGYVDEWYQYQLLYPERENYFDFNDVITDQLGAGLVFLYLYAGGVKQQFLGHSSTWLRSKTVLFSMALVVIVAIFLLTSVIVQYAPDVEPQTLLLLNEADGPEPFWVEFLNTGRQFHILTPLQGILCHLFLIGFYGLMDVKWNSD